MVACKNVNILYSTFEYVQYEFLGHQIERIDNIRKM